MPDDDLDVVDRHGDRRLDIRPAARADSGRAGPESVERLESAGPGMPSQTSPRPELAHDRRGAAGVIGIAVRDASDVEAPDAGVPQHRRRPRGRRCRTTTPPDRPPASTSSVAPRGNRTSAASPCPTSMNVTCRRPSPRRAIQVHGSASIHTRARPAARQRSRRVHASGGELRARRRAHAARQRAHADDQPGVVRGQARSSAAAPPASATTGRRSTEIRRSHQAFGRRRAPATQPQPPSGERHGRRPERRPCRQSAPPPSAESPRSSAPDRRTSRARRARRRPAAGRPRRRPTRRACETSNATADAASARTGTRGATPESRASRRR